MLSKSLSDNELVKEYLSGNEYALEILITRHQKKVFSYIKNVVKDQHIAEDLFQDAFIKVVHTLKSGNYNEEGKFIQWVMRISHNLTMDYFRNNKKMPLARGGEDYDIFDTLDLFVDSAEDKMVKKQILTQVKSLIDHLPEEQKDIVKLRMYEDMSFKEIAEMYKISINTALGRMRYALINLRKLIDKHQITVEI